MGAPVRPNMLNMHKSASEESKGIEGEKEVKVGRNEMKWKKR